LAEQALPHAIAQAECFQAELIVFRVIEPLPRMVGGRSQTTFERAEAEIQVWAHEYLEGIAARVQERGIPVQVATVLGVPSKVIVEFAEQNQVELIIMCTRGQSGLSRWLMGSVADRVVRGANVTVLLVRAQEERT
jgi:nucleotide-binding universal stress UspA family protein